MVTIIKPILREENSSLNEPLITLLENIQAEYFGINEYLNDPEGVEPSDLLNNFETCCEYLKLKTIQKTLSPIIEELESILFIDWDVLEVDEAPPKRKIAPYLKGDKARIWLGEEVKPLILQGIKIQKEVSNLVGVGASTINNRVSNGFECNWEQYVQRVECGIY